MAFTGLFSVTQGSDISQFTLTDTSTDYDATITNRLVYLYKIDGTLLGGAAIDWPMDAGEGDTLTLDLLDKDYSLSIVVQWEVPTPEVGGVYTKTEITTFVGYSNTFIYGIVQQMSANPLISSADNFLNSLSNTQVYVSNAIFATTFADQFAAQSNLDRVYYISQNQTLYF